MNIRLTIITILVVCTVLWAIPGTAHAQVQGGSLFATNNLGSGCDANGRSSIFQYTPDYVPGGPRSIFAPNLHAARGLAFDSAGNLFVATNTPDDSCITQGTIFKITPDGFMSTFASGFPTNFFLQGLVFDSHGYLFVMAGNTNDLPKIPSTIYKVTPDGAVSPFGLQSDCVQQGTNVNCSTPSVSLGLAVDSDGNLYAANVDNQAPNPILNPNIYRFTPAGDVRTIFAGPDKFPPSPADSTQKEGPIGLAFDSSGNLFVSAIDVPGNGVILEFAPNGTVISSFSGLPPYSGARGLAFDAAGNLFVAEVGFNGPGAIQEFPSVGSSPTPSPAPMPIPLDQGIGNSANRGPEYLAFVPSGTTVASGVTSAVALTLPNATAPLTTSVTPVSPAPTPPPNFEIGSNPPLAFEITATPSPTPPIIIAFSAPPPPPAPSPNGPDLSQVSVVHYVCSPNCSWVDSTLHYQCDNQNPPNCGWVDSTQTFHPAGQGGYPDSPATNTVYASVNSLSPFLITKFKFRAQIQQPINSDGSSVFNVRRGAVPVIFTLTSDGASTCQLPPATISVFRTSGGTVGSVDESTYLLQADSGTTFRISGCQYVYNLGASALGSGTYLVNISIAGSVAGSATFALK